MIAEKSQWGVHHIVREVNRLVALIQLENRRLTREEFSLITHQVVQHALRHKRKIDPRIQKAFDVLHVAEYPMIASVHDRIAQVNQLELHTRRAGPPYPHDPFTLTEPRIPSTLNRGKTPPNRRQNPRGR